MQAWQSQTRLPSNPRLNTPPCKKPSGLVSLADRAQQREHLADGLETLKQTAPNKGAQDAAAQGGLHLVHGFRIHAGGGVEDHTRPAGLITGLITGLVTGLSVGINIAPLAHQTHPAVSIPAPAAVRTRWAWHSVLRGAWARFCSRRRKESRRR